MAYRRKGCLGDVVVENQEARRAYVNLCIGVDEVDALHGGRRPLVELPGYVLHGKVFLTFQGAGIADAVGHALSENGVAALPEESVAESEEVIDIDQPQGTEAQRKVFVEFAQEALSLDLKLRILFYVNAVYVHCL